MSTTVAMSKEASEAISLLRVNFPEFEVTDDLIPFIECAENNAKDSDEDFWIPVNDANLLKKLRPIMDPEFTEVFDEADQWEEVVKDVKGGVTFAFYWNDKFINWER